MLELLMSGYVKPKPGGDLIGYWQDPNNAARYTGFYGEVPSANFINATTLTNRVQFSGGTVITGADDFPWLKFLIDGKILYVSKKPFRNAVSRSMLDSSKVVDGQKTVTINDQVYKVRLLTIQGKSPDIYDGGTDPVMSHGSEWNRLMYNIWGDAVPASQEGDKWANYTTVDLGHNLYGTVSGQTCTIGSTVYYSLKSAAVAGFTKVGGNNYTTTGNQGWRPCLELVP